MFKHTAVAIIVALFSLQSFAQEDVPLSGTYTYGAIGAQYFDPCTPGVDSLVTLGERGTIAFNPAGTFTWDSTEHRACASGGVDVVSDSRSGTYDCSLDGTLELDFGPIFGVEVRPFQMTWERDIFVLQGTDPGEPITLIGIRHGVGMSNADFNGTYALAGFGQEQVLGGVNSFVDFGEAAFDGAGNYSSTSSYNEFGPGGQSTGINSDSGAYTILANGQIALGGSGPIGMISADGSVAFVAEWSGTESLLTVLARKGTGAPTSGALDQDWYLSEIGAEQPATFASSAQWGATGVVSIGGFGGAFTFNGDGAWVDLGGSGGGPDGGSGTVLLAADGSLTISNPGSPVANGWLADREDFAIFASLNEASDMSLGILVRDRGPLDTFGIGEVSVGTGGQQPLSIMTGKDNASLPYFVLGSLSGMTPGTPVGGEVMPLNIDGYTNFTLSHPNSVLLPGSFTTLDMFGSGIATFNVPPAVLAAFVGLTLHHAFIVLDPSDPDGVRMVSNAVKVDLVP
ncbi:MAG: hypothetical protein ACI9D0_001094 [Bacteroidia bacterium]|jgi:hypothetical protein